ncbi:MAG: hypothetical protein ABIS03_12185 [Gemmatimonadaceae bacterium]
MILPNFLISQSYLLRGISLWVLTRVAIAGVLLLAGGDAVELSTAAALEVVVLIVALGWIETFRHRERTLLGNLGVSPLVTSLFFAGPAILGELFTRIGGAFFR